MDEFEMFWLMVVLGQDEFVVVYLFVIVRQCDIEVVCQDVEVMCFNCCLNWIYEMLYG